MNPEPDAMINKYKNYPHHLLGVLMACCKNASNVHYLIDEINEIPEEDLSVVQYLKNLINSDKRNTILEECYRNPMGDGFRLLREADMDENEQIVDYLLKHSRLDPSELTNVALMFAVRANNHKVVKCLLQDRRVDPNDRDSQAIKIAIRHGFMKVVHHLLMDERIDLYGLDLQLLEKEAKTVDRYNQQNVELCIKLAQDMMDVQQCRIIDRCRIVKEGIMMKAWHPSRMERLLNAGYDVEDM